MADTSVLVVGQVGRDLVLRVDAVPGPGGSADVLVRRELLGGKGANQAVGMAQLGAPVQLLGVVGEDAVGADLLRSLHEDGVGAWWVRRRGTTALLVDVVDAEGGSRLLEDVPEQSLLRPDDLHDVVSWPGGHRFFPHGTGHVDATGGGDSFLAGLVVGLRAGRTPEEAGELAAACAASTVARLGGRPDLTALRPG